MYRPYFDVRILIMPRTSRSTRRKKTGRGRSTSHFRVPHAQVNGSFQPTITDRSNLLAAASLHNEAENYTQSDCDIPRPKTKGTQEEMHNASASPSEPPPDTQPTTICPSASAPTSTVCTTPTNDTQAFVHFLEHSVWWKEGDAASREGELGSLVGMMGDLKHLEETKRYGRVGFEGWNGLREGVDVRGGGEGDEDACANETPQTPHRRPTDKTAGQASLTSPRPSDITPKASISHSGLAIPIKVSVTSTAPASRWHCCACQKSYSVAHHPSSPNPLAPLTCTCPHRSCNRCTLSGEIRSFAPIEESGTAFVPSSPTTAAATATKTSPSSFHAATSSSPRHNIHNSSSSGGVAVETTNFGIICPTCGVSWRALPVPLTSTAPSSPTSPSGPSSPANRFTLSTQLTSPYVLTAPFARHHSVRNRLSILPKRMASLRGLRSLSMVHLPSSLNPDSNVDKRMRPGTAMPARARARAREDQVRGVQVRFYGMQCSCGRVLDATALCFQVLGEGETDLGGVEGGGKYEGVEKRRRRGFDGIRVSEEVGVEAEKERAELRAMGWETPMLQVRGVRHPNPLRSCPW